MAQATLSGLLQTRPFLSLHQKSGLCFEGVALHEIAARFGTPTYVYGAHTLRARFAKLREAFAAENLPIHIHYAVKANDHLAILSLFRELGAGADVVSLGEFLKARHAGLTPQNIVYSGVGKATAELSVTLAAGIGQINVESAEELEIISALASAQNVLAPIVLRMNPDVDAGTHAKITTGLAGNKFGISAADIPSLYAHASSLPGIALRGLALHIGSQILSPTPYQQAYSKAATMVRQLRAAGLSVEVLDLGGGLGIGYQDEPDFSASAFAALVRETCGDLNVHLMIEPGRYLVGPAGLLLASVILNKHAHKHFTVLDAAMNDLMRPALYDSWHGILPVAAHAFHAPTAATDVVGPICESSDIFAKDRLLPSLGIGAQVAILDAGAYGATMSNSYNARPRAAAVLVENGEAKLITPRQAHAALWADERL